MRVATDAVYSTGPFGSNDVPANRGPAAEQSAPWYHQLPTKSCQIQRSARGLTRSGASSHLSLRTEGDSSLHVLQGVLFPVLVQVFCVPLFLTHF